MASIESLYNQANHTTAADQTELKRQNSENLPIIGSLPVTLSSDTADQDSTQFDDMVLTGLLEAVPAEPTFLHKLPNQTVMMMMNRTIILFLRFARR